MIRVSFQCFIIAWVGVYGFRSLGVGRSRGECRTGSKDFIYTSFFIYHLRAPRTPSSQQGSEEARGSPNKQARSAKLSFIG